MRDGFFRITRAGDGPIVASAIHNGHNLRDDVRALMALNEAERLREEDPCTGIWTSVGDISIVADYSRFQVDLNRPREKAVYRRSKDAWGLRVWSQKLSDSTVERSLADYDNFYATLHELLKQVERRHGGFVLLDLHSYNHRRNGPDAAPADIEGNPEVIVGTAAMKQDLRTPLVDHFIDTLRQSPLFDHPLDVRENIKFGGGHLSRWIHEHFPDTGICLSIEFKKWFMDEWTGQADIPNLYRIETVLKSTLPGLREDLREITSR